ncbi:siderophore-interacting protein [Jiella sonneratiae]|uniref:Siderophore-interacting protein n=1 Tax=Jiella sonneratiae TaxID=2816856 RepID=A0ABS3J0C3_9HYPH|nr:siderophore-interacting protein [Jiella sonneratiae]MBO0903133.1 siderophore-interacting protein [Jiella sonneratiae]
MTFPANALGTAEGPLPDTLVADLTAEVREYGYRHEAQENGLSVEFDAAAIRLRLLGEGLEVAIGAADLARIHEMREAVLFLFDQTAPQLSERMVWSGDLPEGTLPPNFRTARFVGRRKLSPNFLRVTLAAPGVSDFLAGGMHFRLAIPPRDRAPVWPQLGRAGRTVWPKGEDALHCPAYTTAEVDVGAGHLFFDVYLHEGGLATTWALQAEEGAVVGLAGPGGGTLPPGDFILLAGDETALPAIRRILAASPPVRRGHVLVELADPRDRMELQLPDAMSIEWLQRGETPDIFERARAVTLPKPGESRFVWIAGERELARRARLHFRDEGGVPAGESYIAAYWTR